MVKKKKKKKIRVVVSLCVSTFNRGAIEIGKMYRLRCGNYGP
jgi:hypothetical protein